MTANLDVDDRSADESSAGPVCDRHCAKIEEVVAGPALCKDREGCDWTGTVQR